MNQKLINIGVFSLMMALSSLAVADGPTPAPSVSPAPSIKAGMKTIGGLFKAINKAAKDPTQNSASAENARQMVINFQSVINLVPEEIQKMPAPQQPAAIADYKRLIQQEIDFATALKNAFEANDNNGALTILDQMTVTKKEGHSKYNP